jgi:hypothetical protein
MKNRNSEIRPRPGVDGTEGVLVDFYGVNVEEEVGEARRRALQVGGGKGIAEDGTPDVGGQLAQGAPRAFFSGLDAHTFK